MDAPSGNTMNRMRHASIWVSCCAAAALLGAGAGCASTSSGVDSAIRTILADQNDAWNRGDIDAFMRHYWKSPELTFSAGGQTQRGWQATYDRYKARYPTRERMGRLAFDIDRVQPVAGRAALVLGSWRLEREDPIGGNFSLVFEQRDGRWVIIHDHTSVREGE